MNSYAVNHLSINSIQANRKTSYLRVHYISVNGNKILHQVKAKDNVEVDIALWNKSEKYQMKILCTLQVYFVWWIRVSLNKRLIEWKDCFMAKRSPLMLFFRGSSQQCSSAASECSGNYVGGAQQPSLFVQHQLFWLASAVWWPWH